MYIGILVVKIDTDNPATATNRLHQGRDFIKNQQGILGVDTMFPLTRVNSDVVDEIPRKAMPKGLEKKRR